jgi:predicted lysophospholipase L1 biosynthesis ABC-type transport system permease subunit
MKRKGIDRVGLAYFGSALPEGYGIEYAALPSYFPRPVDVGARPRFVAISATLLAGGYVEGDPYARMRDVEPVAVVGGTIYVFDLADGEPR